MIPRNVVKSGMLKTLLRMTIMPIPAPTPPSATAIGRPIARTEPKARISTMMAKARPMNSVSGGSNTASAVPPGSTSRPSMVGRVVGDRLAHRGRLGHVDVGGEVDLGVGELSRQRAVPGDLRFTLLGVGRHDGGARVLRDSVVVGEPGVHGGEQLLHGGGHGGVVDALLGAEDDRPRRTSGAEIGEVAAEDVEAVGTLGVGDLGRRVVGGTDRGGGAEDDDEGGEPDADGRLSVVEAPGPDAGEEPAPFGRGDALWFVDGWLTSPTVPEPGRTLVARPVVFRLSVGETGLNRDTTTCRMGRNRPGPRSVHGSTDDRSRTECG